ncbi:hypothetical protein ACB092_05G265800 [Castanea dentata]
MAAPKRENQTVSQSPQKRTKKVHNQHQNNLVSHIDGVSSNPNRSGNLPDDILDRIFSFLPIKQAVEIGVLSPRFKKSWLFNRKILFDREFSRHHDREEYIHIVNHVFNSHVGSRIQSLSLCFDPTAKEHMIERWLKICAEKGIEELDLDFFQGRDVFKISQFLDIKSLTTLKLVYCEVDLPPQLTGLSFLTTLILKRVDLNIETMETLFFHCLLLETVDLWQCSNIQHLKVCARSLKRFKVLKVRHCTEILSIDIDAPTLRSIYYIGNVVKFQFAEVLHLDEVLLNFSPSRCFAKASLVENLVSDLSYANVLTTTSAFLEGLTTRIRDGAFRDLQFRLWNLKEFQLFMEGTSYCNLFDIASFLKNCPSLEKLFLDLNDFSFDCGFYWELHQKQLLQYFPHFFTSLKFIKVKGFKFQKHELELVRFLLGKAVFLETLVLVTPRTGRIRIYEPADAINYKRLIFSWRASPKTNIVLLDHYHDKGPVQPKVSQFG